MTVRLPFALQSFEKVLGVGVSGNFLIVFASKCPADRPDDVSNSQKVEKCKCKCNEYKLNLRDFKSVSVIMRVFVKFAQVMNILA